jgi:hypothetical protein
VGGQRWGGFNKKVNADMECKNKKQNLAGCHQKQTLQRYARETPRYERKINQSFERERERGPEQERYKRTGLYTSSAYSLSLSLSALSLSLSLCLSPSLLSPSFPLSFSLPLSLSPSLLSLSLSLSRTHAHAYQHVLRVHAERGALRSEQRAVGPQAAARVEAEEDDGGGRGEGGQRG